MMAIYRGINLTKVIIKFVVLILIFIPNISNSKEQTFDSWDFSGVLYNKAIHKDNNNLKLFLQEDSNSTSVYNAQLRLMANYHHPSDIFKATMHLRNDATFASNDFQKPEELKKYRYFDMTNIGYHNDKYFATSVDRLNFTYSHDFFDVIVGRQAITYGKAFFWNLLDVFEPYDPATVIRDYKTGIDAVKVEIPLGSFSGLDLVYSPTKKYGSVQEDQSSLLAHYYTNLKGWDVAFQTGKVYAGYQNGVGITGDYKGIEIRGEANYFNSNNLLDIDDYSSFVLGAGYRFENSLHFQAEYHYNDAGTKHSSQRNKINDISVENGVTTNISRDIFAFSASYEFLPILIGRLSLLGSCNDGSFQIQPDFNYSISDNIDLTFIANLNRGDKPTKDINGNYTINSEFGRLPDVYTLELKWYF